MRDKRLHPIILSTYFFMAYMTLSGQETKTADTLFSEALISKTCREGKEGDLQLFGQFIGSWRFDWTGFNKDGTRQVVKGGEWIFSWVLEGRAIQDVWILPGRQDRGKPDFPEGEYGTTLRHYDPSIQKWRIYWLGTILNGTGTFLAERASDEIVLTETPAGEMRRKWIFSQIEEKSFRWREETSTDDGASWMLTQEFFATRER